MFGFGLKGEVKMLEINRYMQAAVSVGEKQLWGGQFEAKKHKLGDNFSPGRFFQSSYFPQGPFPKRGSRLLVMAEDLLCTQKVVD